MHTRTIEIDIDVHKAIELAREDFTETDNSVLRRMLGIDAEEALNSPDEGRPWVGKGHSSGFVLPHGTALRLQYNTTNLDGCVDDGALVFSGERFASPSGARQLCRTKDGRVPHLNGKTIIEARLPESTEWVRLDALERRMKKAQAA
ncbi:hypothetical protein [Sulfitobacter sp.]|uniref:hypothetical protein n=1 Tax=Sulfitobacter sp. TaxID=1903071 RepID=UPI00272B9D5D|nr:hypothetical protein [Sulfitobacter sp.]